MFDCEIFFDADWIQQGVNVSDKISNSTQFDLHRLRNKTSIFSSAIVSDYRFHLKFSFCVRLFVFCVGSAKTKFK